MKGIPVGELLFKFLTKKLVLNTMAKNSHLMESFINLETYTIMVNYNIKNFKLHMKVKVKGLKERGERSYDLMTNLFTWHQTQKVYDTLKQSRTATITGKTSHQSS